jgi:hypothetical protein
MERSDLSGNPLNGDQATSIRVRFADGRTRSLKVSSQEADELSRKGTEANRLRARVVRIGGSKPVKWLAVTLAAALIFPALTKQWSDRQAELTLKNAMVTDISEGVETAYDGARDVVNSTGSYIQELKARNKTVNAWREAAAKADPSFVAYFPRQSVTNEWTSYKTAMIDYVALACCDQEFHAAYLAAVRDFVQRVNPSTTPAPGASSSWDILAAGAESDPSRYRIAYTWVGLQLLYYRGALEGDLIHANAEGYCSGIVDTFRTIIFLSC